MMSGNLTFDRDERRTRLEPNRISSRSLNLLTLASSSRALSVHTHVDRTRGWRQLLLVMRQRRSSVNADNTSSGKAASNVSGESPLRRLDLSLNKRLLPQEFYYYTHAKTSEFSWVHGRESPYALHPVSPEVSQVFFSVTVTVLL